MKRFVAAKLCGLALIVSSMAVGACAAPLTAYRPGYEPAHAMMPQAGTMTVQNQTGYLSYHAPTLAQTSEKVFVRAVRGEACQDGVAIPFSLVFDAIARHRMDRGFSADIRWGDGSLQEAMRRAMQGANYDETLHDITIDLHQRAILGFIFRQQCLVVQGRLMAPKTLCTSSPRRFSRDLAIGFG